MGKVRSLVIGIALVACATIGLSASASADGSLKDAPLAPPFSWTGIYIGGSAGWARSEVTGDLVTTPTLNHHNVSDGSGTLGIQVGAQKQIGQFVLGLEAGYQKLWAEGRESVGRDCVAQLLGLAAVECRGRINDLFTIGPRIGFVPSSQWMIFATGGYASGRISTSVIDTPTGNELGSSRERHNGLFVGGGVEFAATANWLVGLEYQHVSLRTERHFDQHFGGCCVVTPETRDMKGEADMVTLRASYKFN